MTRVFTLLAASLIAIGSASIASDGVLPRYQTNLGTITLELPRGYVPLSQIDRVKFDKSRASLDESIPTIEIMMSAEDWRAMREHDAPARDDLVYLSLLPGSKPATDESWNNLRKMLLSAIEGGQMDEAPEGVAPRSRFVEGGDASLLENFVDGRAYVVNTGDDEVRWVIRRNMESQLDDGDEMHPVLYTFAWIRKGPQAMMLRSSRRLTSESDAVDAERRFSVFVSAIRFDERIY